MKMKSPQFLTPVSDPFFQLTNPIRLLLEYTDTSYEEKKYTMGDGNDTFLVRHLFPSCLSNYA